MPSSSHGGAITASSHGTDACHPNVICQCFVTATLVLCPISIFSSEPYLARMMGNEIFPKTMHEKMTMIRYCLVNENDVSSTTWSLITGLIAHAHIILFTEPLQWFQALLVLILRGWWWNKPRMQIRNALCERSNICVTSFAAAFWEKRWWCDVNWGMLNTNSVWLMPRMISFNTFLVNVKARSE